MSRRGGSASPLLAPEPALPGEPGTFNVPAVAAAIGDDPPDPTLPLQVSAVIPRPARHPLVAEYEMGLVLTMSR
jgi:hypothetical protein